MRILLLSHSTKEPTNRILQAGVRNLNELLNTNNISSNSTVSVDFLTFDNISQFLQQKYKTSENSINTEPTLKSFKSFMLQRGVYDPENTIVIVLVSERTLSSFSEKKRIPCTSLKTAQMILQEEPSIKLYLVIQPNHYQFTGIDAIASMLFGVAGIVDERSLIDEFILYELLKHQASGRGHRSMLVFGDTLNHVQSIKRLFDNWSNDFESDPDLELPCWKASLALAQLDKLEPIYSSGGNVFSFVKLAQALNFAVEKTSFSLTQNDLRRVLSILASRWLGADHESLERVRLPEIARKHGFPNHLPVVDGISDTDLMRLLFNAIRSIDITTERNISHDTCCTIRLRTKEFPKSIRKHISQKATQITQGEFHAEPN